MKYENKIVHADHPVSESKLNKYGDECWKLVTIVPMGVGDYFYHFAREVVESDIKIISRDISEAATLNKTDLEKIGLSD